MRRIILGPEHSAETFAGAVKDRTQKLAFARIAFAPVVGQADPPTIGEDESGDIDSFGTGMCGTAV